MRAKTLQIVWHGKEPVFSVDFHPTGLLATAGADKDIKLWQVQVDASGDPEAQPVGSISGHTKTVNCVRFSPTGDLLASGGDGGEMILWRDTGTARKAFGSEEETTWKVANVLRFLLPCSGHLDDVQDVSWAPDSSAVVSGSIENLCIVWDVEAGKGRVRLENHKHYVQGVSWDPASRYLATLSSDRTCRVYAPRPPAAGKKTPRTAATGPPSCVATARDLVCTHVLAKRAVTSSAAGPAAGGASGAEQPQEQQQGEAGEAGAGFKERHVLFHDETLPTFFRRLAWAPDGSCLAVPAGSFKASTSDAPANATYLYARGSWAAPAAMLPGLSKASVAVRFAPMLFRRRQQQQWTTHDAPGTEDQSNGNDSVAQQQRRQQQGTAGTSAGDLFCQLPYRMVFAVATLDSVMVYDTESPIPLAVLGSLHFAAITDLAWSSDARKLAVSSRDGYCSIALFEEGELGEPIPADQLEPHVAHRVAAAQKTCRPQERKPKEVTAPLQQQQQQAGSTPAAAVLATPVAAAQAVAADAASAMPAAGAGPTSGCDAAQAMHGSAAPPSGKKRRITPQLLTMEGPSNSGAAGPAGSHPGQTQPLQPLEQRQQQAATTPGAAPAPAAKKRITPHLVQPLAAQLPATRCEPSAAAGERGTPAGGQERGAAAGRPMTSAPSAQQHGEGQTAQQAKKRIVPQPI